MQTRRSERRPPIIIPTRRDIHDAELVDEMEAFIDEIDSILEDNTLEAEPKGGE